MCFPDINTEPVFESAIHNQHEQRAAIFLLFLLLFYTQDCEASLSKCRTWQAAAGGSLLLLGSSASTALLPVLLGCEGREGGQGQGRLQGSPVQTAQTQAERKTSPLTGFILCYFYFKNMR